MEEGCMDYAKDHSKRPGDLCKRDAFRVGLKPHNQFLK